jgi:competence protein ComEC
LVVGLALLPLAVVFFGEVSLAGFPVNLIAVPFFSFVLVPAALLLAGAAILGVGDDVLARIVEPVATGVWHVLGHVADYRLASVELAAPGAVVIVLFAAGVALLFGVHGRKRWLGIVACTPLLLRSPARPEPGAFALTVLDVGHGLAIVVRTATRTLLFDAGPLARSGFDAGAEIVVPALRALSPAGLDMIVVSHGDNDHAGGLDAVRARYATAALIAGPDLALRDAPVCLAGRSWTWDRVRFSLVHPAGDFDGSGNDSSCVLRIDSAGGSALLTGDIESRAETELVAAGLVPVDIVVAPHHGSATSSTAQFVQATRPSHVIVSAAYANRWNFPRPEVVARWRDIGADILATGDSGAVTVSVSADGVSVEQKRRHRVRYWHAGSGTGTGSAL